jgi:hypothetical protein
MAQHSKYWSCTKFADWVRGTKKLSAGTSEEWNNWRTVAQTTHRFRYWLAEEALDAVQDFVTWPVRKIYDAKYYVNNRWVTCTHSLTAHRNDIRPGKWCDVGNRFLPCLFNELVDFVEIETAWSHIAWGNKENRAKYNAPFWATGWFRWRTWRSPEAGVDHLKWAMSLVADENWGLEEGEKGFGKPTHQALAAKEIYDLYTWWKEVYPNRPDPYDASGWTTYCEEERELNGGRLFGGKTTPALKKKSNQAHKLLRKIEAQYEKEDTDMLIRLIKIRQSLWT